MQQHFFLRRLELPPLGLLPSAHTADNAFHHETHKPNVRARGPANLLALKLYSYEKEKRDSKWKHNEDNEDTTAVEQYTSRKQKMKNISMSKIPRIKIA